ncbi:hypothetical protein UlMin_015671 [Ulmus minor]
MEFHKLLANAKRNLKIYSQRVFKATWKIKNLNFTFKGGAGYVKLEELLVEKGWLKALPREFQKPYSKNLCKFFETKIKYMFGVSHPYHGPGQAMGLSFSVPEGVKVPSSLSIIFKELKQDLGCSIPSHRNLEKWAVQYLLLNCKFDSENEDSWIWFLSRLREVIGDTDEVVFISDRAQSLYIYQYASSKGREFHPYAANNNRTKYGVYSFFELIKFVIVPSMFLFLTNQHIFMILFSNINNFIQIIHHKFYYKFFKVL